MQRKRQEKTAELTDKFQFVHNRNILCIAITIKLYLLAGNDGVGKRCMISWENGQGVHDILGKLAGGALYPRKIGRGCMIS